MWILSDFKQIILAFSKSYWGRDITIKRWRALLELDKHQSVFESLYAAVDGFTLSRAARGEQDAMEYIYGEIDFPSFIALLSLVKPDNQTVFYDFGSGTGKAVLACAMVFDVRESNGIELFGPLHNAACDQQKALYSLPDYTPTCKTIHFVHDDFLHANFSNATLVYIDATGFFGPTWIAISERLAQTPSCTTVITTSRPLKSDTFIITRITDVQMSWGVVKAYIQQRINFT